MSEIRNLILNPRPSTSGPSMWLASGVSMRVESDTLRLESDGGSDNAFAWMQATLPAGEYVFAAFLEGSSTGGLVSYDQRALAVTTQETGWRLNGWVAYTTLMTRYACAFRLEQAGNVNLRLYSHSTGPGNAVRWRDMLLCTLDDWLALRETSFDYFDGSRTTSNATIVFNPAYIETS